ncbi:hypothetical protein BJ170DRAFT_696886 [Xylariales sp. AK1849]|nr:hypothetical protein BJ170DRAFT_696886 [Xylariales sp. AK1849]
MEPTPVQSRQGYLHIKVDLAGREVYTGIFAEVQTTLGGVPGIVVNNTACLGPLAVEGNMFPVPAESLNADLEVELHGPYVAARKVLKLWSEQNHGGKPSPLVKIGQLPYAHYNFPSCSRTDGVGCIQDCQSMLAGLGR